MAMRNARPFQMQSGLVLDPKLFIRKATKACKLYSVSSLSSWAGSSNKADQWNLVHELMKFSGTKRKYTILHYNKTFYFAIYLKATIDNSFKKRLQSLAKELQNYLVCRVDARVVLQFWIVVTKSNTTLTLLTFDSTKSFIADCLFNLFNIVS